MPDAYGRPTFQDGMAIAQGLKSIAQDNEEQQAAAIAQKIAENPEWKPAEGEKYSPNALWKGRALGTSAALDKLNLSEAGMKEKSARYQLEHTEFQNEWAKSVAPLLTTQPDKGIEAAFNVFNKNLKNGLEVRVIEGNKIEITNTLTGTKSVQQAPTVEQINEMALGFMDPKASISQRLAWDQMIKEKNLELALKAEDLRDPKTGASLGVKSANFFDKATNSVRPVYLNSMTGKELTGEELTALHKKGFISAEDLKTTLDLQKRSYQVANEQVEQMAKLMGIKKTKLDMEKTDLEMGKITAETDKIKGEAGKKEDKELNALYKEVSDNFRVGPNDVDKEGKPFTASEKVAIDVRNYLRNKGYDAYWDKQGDGTFAMRYIQKGKLPMDKGEVDVGGKGGLASATEKPKPAPKEPKAAPVPKRKPGESIETYLARTRK